MQSRIIFVLFFALCSVFSGHGFSGDYVVSYAFDANGLEDAGTIRDCRYGYACEIRPKGLDLTISLSLYLPSGGSRKDLGLSIDGGRTRPDCCFFSDGVRYLNRTLEDAFVRLGVYEGHARRRNEFVRNSPLGMLYLQFSDTK